MSAWLALQAARLEPQGQVAVLPIPPTFAVFVQASSLDPCGLWGFQSLSKEAGKKRGSPCDFLFLLLGHLFFGTNKN